MEHVSPLTRRLSSGCPERNRRRWALLLLRRKLTFLRPAKAEWKRLIRELFALGVVTALDRAALAAYCQAYGRWAEAERKLKETPMLLKLPSGYIQPSPWLAIANKQLELMAKYMAELGLSPVSRTRVEAKPPHEKKLWEFGREWVDPRSTLAELIGPRQDDSRRETVR